MSKNSIFNFVLFIAALLFSTSSCKKEDAIIPYNPQLDFAYYPMNIGSFIEYDVDYIFWDDFTQTVDTTNYILREYIESILVNYSGDTLYRIERNTKSHPDSAWNVSQVWYCGVKDNYIFKVEENIRYVKLIVPIQKNSEWDGNIYNDLETQSYKYVSVDEPKQFGNQTFDKCVTVLQQNYESLINQDFEEEIFAYNTGLVFKKQIHVDKTYNQITQRFEITSGFSLVQTIKDYGTIQ